MKSNLTRRVFPSIIALGMLLSLLPVAAFAAPGDASSGDLVLNKTATLEDDGTYTIDLEAYAKGEIKITEEKVPCDIVLVLDQSGSMAEDFSYTTSEPTYRQVTEADTYHDTYVNEVYHKCVDGQYRLLNVTREAESSVGEFFNMYTYRYTCPNEACNYNHAIHNVTYGGYRRSPAEKKLFGGWKNEWAKEIYIKEYTTVTQTRLEALKNTLNQFVSNVEKDAADNNIAHKIAVVGFASESGYGNNTEILTVAGRNTDVDENTTIGVAYNPNNSEYTNAIPEALVNCSDTIVDQAISSLAAYGATRADLGMEMAQKILAANKEDGRKQVVIMFTDGSPTSSNGFEEEVANDAIAYAKAIKDTGADVYTIGIYEGANGDAAINNSTSQENTFMHAVSSNYLQAASMTDYGPLNKLGYFRAASDADKLKEIFNAISESVSGGTSVTLDSTAVLRDIVSDSFIVPTGASVTAKKVPYLGKNTWNETGAIPINSSNIKIDGNTIEVKGFDYAADYVHEAESDVPAGGYKLAVTIKGVEATDKAVTNDNVNTNKEGSGIYGVNDDGSELLAGEFDSPVTKLTSKTFVLDYAKPVTLSASDWNMTSTTKIGGDMAANQAAVSAQYGNAVVTDGSSLTYTPKTMAWGGYDSFYVFGKTKDSSVTAVEANENGNLWSKISVLPANNVYYEDTFVTNEGSGTVGIKYSADGWTTAAEGSNTGDASNDEHGWITSMKDDATYSDGTVATGSAGATATFSFTGTGVDIYSQTNMKTGLVVAKLYEGGNTTSPAHMKKSLTIDNLAQSGDYYQIPTVSFSGLDYGTYTVKLTVAATSKTGTERSTYYLDGIRVYNPLSETQEAKNVVQEAYGDEIGASFRSVREILIDKKSLEGGATDVSGAVFIDYYPDEGMTGTKTATIGTYENYGPKNEVYLAKDQAIAFNVGTEVDKLSVGLKAPDGATKAQVTNGEQASVIDINAASDQYYKIAPNKDGYVIIMNTGNNLLSVTKLKMCGESSTPTVSGNTRSMMTYANSFDSLPVVAYTLMDAEADGSGATQETGNVVVENPANPAPEKPSAPSSDAWIRELLRSIHKIMWS